MDIQRRRVARLRYAVARTVAGATAAYKRFFRGDCEIQILLDEARGRKALENETYALDVVRGVAAAALLVAPDRDVAAALRVDENGARDLKVFAVDVLFPARTFV